MEQMFNILAPAQTPAPQPPAATSIAPPPHIVSITPVSPLPPAKSEEPMDAAPSQPAPPEVKKGLSKVKGSSLIQNSPFKRWSLKSKCRLPQPLTNVPTKHQPPTINGFRDIARTRY